MIIKKVVSLFLLILLPTVAYTKDWWIIKEGEPCHFANGFNNVDFRPETLLKLFPSCFVSKTDDTILLLDCTKSNLNFNGTVLYTSSKKVCEKFHEQKSQKTEADKKFKKYLKSPVVAKVAWWIIYPNDTSALRGCWPAEGWMSPDTMLKDHAGCFKDQKADLAKGLMMIDCTKSDLHNSFMFSKTIPLCQKVINKIHSMQSEDGSI